MSKKLILIHTLSSLIDVFDKLATHLAPELQLIHVLDEILLEYDELDGDTRPLVEARLHNHITSANSIGASGILATCSILSEPIDDFRTIVQIPLVKIDEKMAKLAVQMGKTIGVLATNHNTLRPSSQILEDQATALGKEITLIPTHVPKAFDAVRRGEQAYHDQLVKQGILELSPKVDLIVLAQASMAGVLFQLSDTEKTVPILSSPQIALEEALEMMQHSKAPTIVLENGR